MKTVISPDKQTLGREAALAGAEKLRAALDTNGSAAIIVATGASQFEMLQNLVTAPGIDWSRVTVFHLDEYVGMGTEHPASFVRYLQERFLAALPQAPAAFHPVNGLAEPEAECARLNELISRFEIVVCFAGIGENGHLAFNDPPADFETEQPYIVVELDEACRRQQLGEGWFPSLADVPTRAISMSVRQILKSKSIICSIPDQRKAEAVKACVQGPVTPCAPASILQTHPDTILYLDIHSASLLD